MPHLVLDERLNRNRQFLTHRLGNGKACWSGDSAESLRSLFFCCLPADIAFSRSFRNWLLFKLLDRPLKIIVLSSLSSPFLYRFSIFNPPMGECNPPGSLEPPFLFIGSNRHRMPNKKWGNRLKLAVA